MDQQPKKPQSDLSDLKARLGLSKTEAGAAPGSSTGVQPIVGHPTGRQQAVAGLSQGTAPNLPRVTNQAGPPGAAPGLLQTTGTFRAAAAAPPDPRRDPFAVSHTPTTATLAAANITDAGPPIALPEPTQKHTALILAIGAVLLLGLGLGYMFGGVSHARKLFNRTIEDAQRIQVQIQKVSTLESGISSALNESRKQHQGQIIYDPTLLDRLKQLTQASALGSVEGAKEVENTLFRSNYAMMDDVLISQLFSYYNNTLRLVRTVEDFLDEAEASKAAIVQYTSKNEAAAEQRKYGIVFAEDKGTFYLGALVEVGRPFCADASATAQGRCKADEIQGFEVRTSGGREWSQRVGKPTKKGQLADVVIPIIPDRTWQDVAAGNPGALAHARYAAHYQAILRIVALLDRDRKPLLESLDKQSNRETLASF